MCDRSILIRVREVRVYLEALGLLLDLLRAYE